MESNCHGDSWRISARSTGSTSCVEARIDGRQVLVRNSNDPEGPVLTVTTVEWARFRTAVAAGHVDHAVLAASVSVPPFGVGLAADGRIELSATPASGRVVVSYTRLEWDTFVAGVTLDGEFTLEWLAPASAGA